MQTVIIKFYCNMALIWTTLFSMNARDGDDIIKGRETLLRKFRKTSTSRKAGCTNITYCYTICSSQMDGVYVKTKFT